ncbi:MAG: hypothetical protein FK730_11145 [Asgard group archaeon]|nr:hypothetical protein [Asgard group archaeon]
MFIVKHQFDDMKDITLRGVNKELYDQFTAFAKKVGASTGIVFTNILIGYIHQPWRIHGSSRGRKPLRQGIIPEMISDLDKLSITKTDLTAAGESTMYLFSNIKELIFEKDVDAITLVKHVKMIHHCNTKFSSNIPKLIELGITRKVREYNHPTDLEQLTNITIRNVSSKVYDEFLAKAKSDGYTTGEFFSKILTNMLPFFELRDVMLTLEDHELLIVSLEDKLLINKSDLEVLGNRKVIFYGIRQLEFVKDIDQELFLKTVFKIVKSDEVILPGNLPKLIVLSRTIMCKEIHHA